MAVNKVNSSVPSCENLHNLHVVLHSASNVDESTSYPQPLHKVDADDDNIALGSCRQSSSSPISISRILQQPSREPEHTYIVLVI
jgi:hypothetical protein